MVTDWITLGSPNRIGVSKPNKIKTVDGGIENGDFCIELKIHYIGILYRWSPAAQVNGKNSLVFTR